MQTYLIPLQFPVLYHHGDPLAEPNAIVGNYHRLQGLAEELDNEISMLIHNLKWHAKSCVKLMRENKSLSDELKLTCGTDMISTLEAQNPHRVDQSLHGEKQQ
ncbi:unnamed protein product [Ilex paraguariensis]|uniref:Uncharacterized protein n=1 Tax=Ilex paraguariensis TaxID=185542 RepID=A0ABC8RCA3_9AQUA